MTAKTNKMVVEMSERGDFAAGFGDGADESPAGLILGFQRSKPTI
jgi:hypothetical protein